MSYNAISMFLSGFAFRYRVAIILVAWAVAPGLVFFKSQAKDCQINTFSASGLMYAPLALSEFLGCKIGDQDRVQSFTELHSSGMATHLPGVP